MMSSSSWLSDPSLCVKLVQSREQSVLDVVQSLNSHLVNEDVSQRKNAVKCLVALVTSNELQNDVEARDSWPNLFEYLVSKLNESVVVATEAVPAVLHLVLEADNVDDHSKMSAMRTIMDELTVQSLTVDHRLKCFESLVYVVDKEKEMSRLDETFVLALARAVEGETHPKCLYLIFSLWSKLLNKNGNLNDLAMEEVFEALACYFPIDYKPRNNSDVSVDQLKSSLHRAITFSPKFVDSGIALFLENLASDLDEAKIDALQCLELALPKYSPLRMESHLEDLWNCLKQEIMGIRANSSEESLRTEINSKCLQVLKVATETLCKSSTTADVWIDRAWNDLKPFLRFVESGLMETAVKMLAAICNCLLPLRKLLSESVAILIESARKHEADEGSSRFLDMTSQLLLSIPTDELEEEFRLQKETEKVLIDFCSECCFHPKEANTRNAGIKLAIIAQKRLKDEEWEKLLLKCFDATTVDDSFLVDPSTMLTLTMTMSEQRLQKWLESQVLPVTEKTSKRVSTLLVELCKQSLIEGRQESQIFNTIYEEFLSKRLFNAIEEVNEVLEDNSVRLQSLKSLLSRTKEEYKEDNSSSLLSLITKMSRRLSASDTESVSTIKELLSPPYVVERNDLQAIIIALESNFLLQLQNLVDFNDAALDSNEDYQRLRASVLNKTHRQIDYSDYLSRIFDADDFKKSKWAFKALMMSAASSNIFLKQGLKLVVQTALQSETNVETMHQLLEDDAIFSPSNHHVVLPFYKQRFFQLVLPLLRPHLESEDRRATSTLLALLPFVPKETVTQSEAINALLPLLARRALVKENEDVAVGLALVPILKDVDIDLSNELSVPFLLRVSVQGNMKQRIEALELLQKLSKICKDRVVRRRVTDELVTALDDRKRLVRSAAVAARNTWFLED